MRPRVLVALPAALEGDPLATHLRGEGWEAEVVTDGGEARAALTTRGPWDVLVADADGGGDALLESALGLEQPPCAVLLSAFGTIRDAVDAVRRGAFDYLARPASAEQVALAARRALEQRALRAENLRLRRSVEQRFDLGRFSTRDARTRRVLELVEAVADTRANVLIQGESGTGKSLLARVLHERSSRAKGPFVVVNCGALPPQLLESELFGHVRGAFTGAVRDKPGRFEEADGGTLFLDEVATASPDLQVKLLRAVQDRIVERVGSNEPREIDVRFVFASNRDLAGEVAAGRFREDLYYRIHVVALELPPLRERPGDVPLLADAFLERFAREYGRDVRAFSRAALARLTAAPWPGNVRQLENAVERAVLLAQSPRIEPADLGNDLVDALLAEPAEGGRQRPAALYPVPEPGERPATLKEALEEPERRILEEALARNGWCRQETARMLGINRTTLFNKMRKHRLRDPARSPDAGGAPLAGRGAGQPPDGDAT